MSKVVSRALSKLISVKNVRERTYEVVGFREDKKDAIGQLVIITNQLLEDKFTGQIIINLGQGYISTIVAKDISKV